MQKYEFVHRLVQDFPELKFTLNGGIDTLSHAQRELEACSELNGVMIGRGFAADPWSFSLADKLLYKASPIPTIESTGKTMKNRLQLLTEYGKHADAEEESGDPVKIRRFITKAVTTLFTSEPNAKQYRIALDEIARLPKQLESEGKCLQTHPPLSELILNAAHSHISEEVLLRTPEESYEKKIYEESKANERLGRSSAVLNWQSSRLMTQNE
jgi:tRNA-dihydrouridine synthase